MSKRQILILLGVWVITFLFLGFPSTWMKPLAIVSGVLIILISYRLNVPEAKNEQGSKTFVEYKSNNLTSQISPDNK